MTLPSTAGSSNEAPAVMRRCVYMSDDGDMVRWQGELQQPDVHYIYRSKFIAVDVHNKLSVGLRSVCSVGANSLVLKVFLSVAASAETNAYLMYIRHHKLTSDVYNHADFKVDLERGLLQHAQQAQQATDGGERETGVVTRRSRDSMATGAAVVQRKCMPSMYQGHALTRQDNTSLKCIGCGKNTKSLCKCGRAICSSDGGVTCWAWHLEAVASGAITEQPLLWKRSTPSRA
jgi:hypothetical protein